jgi:hypothetical protein
VTLAVRPRPADETLDLGDHAIRLFVRRLRVSLVRAMAMPADASAKVTDIRMPIKGKDASALKGPPPATRQLPDPMGTSSDTSQSRPNDCALPD